MLQKNEKKKYQIQGFRFTQNALNTLRDHVTESDSLGYAKNLDASATAMYVALFSVCNTSGQIASDVSISSIAEKVGLPRTTGLTGMTQLLDRGLVLAHPLANNKTQYEIAGYAADNLAREESSNPGASLNYFKVPFALLNSEVLAKLVNMKEARGIILMLEQFNQFRHELRIKKNQPTEFKHVRSLNKLKEKLGKTCAKRVRDVLEVLSPVLTFEAVNPQKRKPRNLVNRIRNAVTQIWVTTYEVTLNPICLVEQIDYDVDAIKALKDADYHIRNLKIPLYQADHIGIRGAYKTLVKDIACFIKNTKMRSDLLRGSMQHALTELEQYIKMGNTVKSIGAYIRSKLKEYVFRFLDKHSLFIDLNPEIYKNTNSTAPKVWEEYREYRKKDLAK